MRVEPRRSSPGGAPAGRFILPSSFRLLFPTSGSLHPCGPPPIFPGATHLACRLGGLRFARPFPLPRAPSAALPASRALRRPWRAVLPSSAFLPSCELTSCSHRVTLFGFRPRASLALAAARPAAPREELSFDAPVRAVAPVPSAPGGLALAPAATGARRSCRPAELLRAPGSGPHVLREGPATRGIRARTAPREKALDDPHPGVVNSARFRRAPIAQLDRAQAYEAWCRKFESSWARQLPPR